MTTLRSVVMLSLALALVSMPLAVEAQPAGKRQGLCFLVFSLSSLRWAPYDPFFKRLRDLGYVDGESFAIHRLSADGQGERFPALVDECLRLKVDVIVAGTTPAALAAKNAIRTVPIVMLGLGDPVATGLVSTLARPGGNVTGLSFMAPGTAAKRLELLKETIPRLSRVLVLSYLTDPIAAPQVGELKMAARALGLRLQIRDIRTPDDLPAAFDAGVKEGAQALLTTAESIF